MWCVVKEEEGRIEEEWLFVLFIYIFFFLCGKCADVSRKEARKGGCLRAHRDSTSCRNKSEVARPSFISSIPSPAPLPVLLII